MSRRGYLLFLAFTSAWIAVSRYGYGEAAGLGVGSAIVWWGLLVMLIAAACYVIQDLPAARTTAWLKRDLLVNTLMLVVILLVVMDGLAGFRYSSVTAAGWVALGAAFLHPIVVDLPHLRRHRSDPGGSPMPQYVPPACLIIDWTLAGLVAVGLVLL